MLLTESNVAKIYSYVVGKRPEGSNFSVKQQSTGQSENIGYYSMHIGVSATDPDKAKEINKVVFYVPDLGTVTKTKDQGFEIGITSYDPTITVKADIIMNDGKRIPLE